ncbi:MAG: twin-arginine translocase TatA/TatE family subunit [Candidatus Hydrogenedentota bacterium]
MWHPGIGELLIILVIVLVIFGAGKLPQVGRSLGSAITEFKESVQPKDEEETSASGETTTPPNEEDSSEESRS